MYNRIKKAIAFAAMIAVVLCAVVGCGESEKPDNGGAVTQYSMGTGASTGGYYYQGAAISQVFNNLSDSYAVSIEATGGTAENIGLLASEDIAIGLAALPDVMDALSGINGYEGRQADNLKIVMVTGFNYIQWFALANSDITNVNQLKDRQLGYAVSAWQMRKTLNAMFDWTVDEDYKCQYAAHADNSESLKDGIIEAWGFDSSIPNATVTDLATTHDVVMLDTSAEDYAKLQSVYGYYGYNEIPAETYPGQTTPIHAITVPVVIVTHENADEEFIYQLVKAICENTDELATIYAGCAQYSKDGALNGADTELLHEGAYRYFKEIGMVG